MSFSNFIWSIDILLASVVMNFALCAVIGMTMARHAASLRTAWCFGTILSLGVEITQLTGIWGIYPCAYRQFEVDDLILNVSGVLAGYLLGRSVGLSPRPC